ncbi:hypothetical protein [Pararhodonellum marinum]|uniref:hypothetical protein n=1 Tax=Pararhodonellum marinum TaxID=2755358 RepID=UPI00188DFF6F|nr:hypothetical protein [Pararhodonellum marinum]
MTTFFLQLNTTVKQEKINATYQHRFVRDYEFIDQEIKSAAEAHGVEFDPKTIGILKKWQTESSFEQVKRVKEAFSKNTPVSMDTIILQRIIIRNFKQREGFGLKKDEIENWPYALPMDILRQIYKFEVNAKETKALFGILKEQIDLVNTPYLDREAYDQHTETERRRSVGARYQIPKPLLDQLNDVKRILLAEFQYAAYAKDLHEIRDKD